MTPGIHFNLPASVYHSSPGISNSMLSNMDPPARLPVYLREKREPTPYMRMGTLIHHAILEPGREMPGFIMQPETYPDSKGGVSKWHNGATWCKNWREEQASIGNEVLTKDEFATLTGCVRALESDPLASAAFSQGEGEVSLCDELTLPSGRIVTRRARLDWVRKGQVIYDVKKVGLGMASPQAFGRLAYDRRYYVQSAYYMDLWNAVCRQPDPRLKEEFTGDRRLDGIITPEFEQWMDFRAALDHGERVESFVFFAVEDSAPYLVNRFEVIEGSHTHLMGRERYMKDLETYAQCCETGIWPGYGEGFQPLEMPRWAI